MRRRGTIALVATALLATAAVPAAASPSDPGPPSDPHCRIVEQAARESHGIRISTRCNFAQIAIRVTAARKVYGFQREPTLHGPTDPGDEMRCQSFRRARGKTARCEGRAGSGVRVGTYFVTRNIACDVPSTVRVTGTADCPPDVACPEIAYEVKREFDRPSGCGP